MEVVDDETSVAALKFIEKAAQDEYADGMVEHDRHIGLFLKKLDELGISDNTKAASFSLDQVMEKLRQPGGAQ